MIELVVVVRDKQPMRYPNTKLHIREILPALMVAGAIAVALVLVVAPVLTPLSAATNRDRFTPVTTIASTSILVEDDGAPFMTIMDTTLVAPTMPDTPLANRFRIVPRRRVLVTAYSSTLDQTDASPFITARGTLVRDGIIAANFLPFGTKVRLPKIWPHKIFTVEDRMHARFSDRVDIWFATREEALAFGLKITELEIF